MKKDIIKQNKNITQKLYIETNRFTSVADKIFLNLKVGKVGLVFN